MGIGHRELRAGNQTGAKGQEKKYAGEDKGFERRAVERGNILRFARTKRLPVDVGRGGSQRVFWNLGGHEVFKADRKSAPTSTAQSRGFAPEKARKGT